MAVATGGRRHHAVDGAAPERWRLLGRLLRARRLELGYIIRRKFAEARLPLTDEGNVNTRMVITVENNERQNYAPGRLEQFARAYQVTPESVYAVLEGKADELTPAPPAVLPAALPPDRWRPPEDDPQREDAIWPHFRPVYARLLELRGQGTADPSGAQVFGAGTPDAVTWDSDVAQKLDVLDRGWLIAMMRRNAAARAGAGDPEGHSAGA